MKKILFSILVATYCCFPSYAGDKELSTTLIQEFLTVKSKQERTERDVKKISETQVVNIEDIKTLMDENQRLHHTIDSLTSAYEALTTHLTRIDSLEKGYDELSLQQHTSDSTMRKIVRDKRIERQKIEALISSNKNYDRSTQKALAQIYNEEESATATVSDATEANNDIVNEQSTETASDETMVPKIGLIALGLCLVFIIILWKNRKKF